MNLRRPLAIVVGLGLLGATAQAQHHSMGSNQIPSANNPVFQGNGFGTGYNNPLTQGAGFGTGYNNPIYQGLGFGTGYNNPIYQGVGFGTGYNDPLQQNGIVPTQQFGSVTPGVSSPVNRGSRSAINSVLPNTGTGAVGYSSFNQGFGVGAVSGGFGGYGGYGGYGGWNYNQGYGYNGGYYNPMNQGGMAGNNGNTLIPVGLNPNGNLSAGPRENPAVSAALNGTNPSPKRGTRSKSSKTSKRTVRRR